jgi:hypothetical protein
MGMEEAFLSADFSGISDDPLFVSFVKQLTHLVVNEKGVEASAATVIGIPISIGGPTPTPVTIDKPFYFTIEDNSYDKVMFIGHINTIDEETVEVPDSLNKIGNTSSEAIFDMMGHRQTSLGKGLNIVQQGGKSRLILVK